jgi:hypothetical protein
MQVCKRDSVHMLEPPALCGDGAEAEAGDTGKRTKLDDIPGQAP